MHFVSFCLHVDFPRLTAVVTKCVQVKCVGSPWVRLQAFNYFAFSLLIPLYLTGGHVVHLLLHCCKRVLAWVKADWLMLLQFSAEFGISDFQAR